METKKKMLVVDDLREFLTMVKAILSKDYEIVTAHNGEEAIELLENGLKPDLIVTDLRMPCMDGHQLIARIRNSKNGYKNLPIVVLSSVDKASERRELLRQGISGYIQKPFHALDLKQNLRTSMQQALAS